MSGTRGFGVAGHRDVGRNAGWDLVIRTLVGTLLVCAATAAWADGKMYPSVVVPRFPDMPGQAAILVWRDGVETLIVESSFAADEGKRFCWVLPVPAAPTSIEQGTPGTIATLRQLFVPEIIGESAISWGTPAVALGLAILWTLGEFLPFWQRRGRSVFKVLFWVGCAAILVWIFVLPGFLRTRENTKGAVASVSESTGAKTLSRQLVGNYDVAVVKAKGSDELFAWLEEHEFAPMKDVSAKILDDYIAEGWVFVLAQLATDAPGTTTPHPLRVTFPSKEPIYPMRLTGAGGDGGTTKVALYVAGHTEFSHPKFRRRVVDRLERIHVIHGVGDFDLSPRREETYFLPKEKWTRFAHPELVKLFQDGEWLTWIEADLDPRDMATDIVLKPKGVPKVHRPSLYTPGAAWLRGAQIGCVSGAVLLLLICVAFRKKHRRGLIAGGIALGVAGLIAVGTFLSLEKLTEYRLEYGMRMGVNYRTMRTIVWVFLDEAQKRKGLENGQKLRDTPELRRELLDYLEGEHFAQNPFDGGDLRIEDSPGNIFFRTDANGNLAVETYDRYGDPSPLEWDTATAKTPEKGDSTP